MEKVVFDLSKINYQTLYYFFDILLKIVLGIFVFIYVNTRNNNIKKKEILYDLFLDLIKDRQVLKAKRTNAYFYKSFEGVMNRTVEGSFDIHLNEVYDICAKKYENDYHEYMKSQYSFKRISEAIELILGVRNKKWSLLRLELETLLFYDGARKVESNGKSILLVYNNTWETARSGFKEECDGIIKFNFDGLISDREMYTQIEDKLYFHLYQKYYEQHDTKIDELMNDFTKKLKHKIEKL